MKKRKKIIINREFQLKQTFSIIKITFCITAFIVGIMVFNIALNNHKLAKITKNNEDIIKNLDNIIIIQDNVVDTIMTWAQKPMEKPHKRAIKEVAKRHYNNIKSIKGNISIIQNNVSSNNRIIRYNNILLILIIIVVILQSIILYYIMIRKTHRISGPIYVMSKYIREIIDGKTPTVRPLRRRDELKDFYDLFTEMVETLKEREKKN